MFSRHLLTKNPTNIFISMKKYDIMRMLFKGEGAMIFKDYYKILGLDNSKVTPEEIKTAYREQAKKYHPDINSENNFSEERFKDINEAYKVLSNQVSRRKYDRTWNSNIGRKKKKTEESKREEGSISSNFFNMFFGEQIDKQENKVKKKEKVPIKGENVETEIEVSVEEAYYGQEKKISLRTQNGKMKTFTIKIPEGIRNGEKIRLIGQGKKGENGGKNGDLLIRINIKDTNKFALRGVDLYTDLKISPWEAVLGTKVSVESIGETIYLHIPQGIESGEKVRIPGKGYKDGKGGRGELIADVKIMIPKTPTKEEIGIYEKLNQISKFNPRTNLE